jgi:prepilin-type N-terminal cleavage/methylation domain-containing protein
MIRKLLNQIKKNSNHQGFTLLELLMGMAIFAIGILAVGTMQIRSVYGNTSARKQTAALTWAADRAETLVAAAYDAAALNAGTYAPPQNNDFIDNNSNGIIDEDGETGIYSISWTITDIDLSGNGTNDAKRIQVQVTWDDRGGQRNTFINVIKTDV